MKRIAKIGIGGFVLTLGAILLSSCTASFCSTKDSGHIMYAYDPGVTTYSPNCINGSVPLTIDGVTINDVYVNYSFQSSQALTATIKTAYTNGIVAPGWDDTDKKPIDNPLYLEYYKVFDNLLLKKMLIAKGIANPTTATAKDILECTVTGGSQEAKFIGAHFGHLKFLVDDSATSVWDGILALSNQAEDIVANDPDFGLDCIPSKDFKKLYKNQMQTYMNSARTCLTTDSGFYGAYSDAKESVFIEGKTYQYGWGKGFLEGLLIWPIGAFIDVLAKGFGSNTMTNGVPQILAIIVATIIIRSIMLLATFKTTSSNAKMTELQPEIAKIQSKYPNANTNSYEKQRMAEEMQKLYKKNKINPFSTILVLIIQFPVFICVWGALSGSAVLTSGKFLGLNLSDSISSVLFSATNWTYAGGYAAVTALFLFLLMAAAQAVSMLLPQWMQKRRAKQVAALGKNPAKKSQDNKMKWFTYIMLAMIIFMGFSLASAMGVYWLIGAIFSVAQTLITQAITERKKKTKRY